MMVLHTAFHDDVLVLWGEMPAAPDARPVRRRGRKPQEPRPQPLPFAAAPADLSRAAGAVCTGFTPPADQAVTRIAWLPTAGGVPLASSPLVAESPGAAGTPDLAPWTVPALVLLPAQAIELLSAALERPALALGVLAGADLRYWAQAMRFAGSLVARQRFLPGVIETGGAWWARWEPVFLGDDAERLARLAAAMPGVCRSLTAEGAVGPPAAPAARPLAAFVGWLADHVIRTSSAPAAGAADRGRGGPPAFDSLHDQWLYALTAADGRLSGGAAELGAFAGQVRTWQRPIAFIRAAPFRFCFRLEEPAPDDGTQWTVHYLLQAADDPSLIIPVADAWHARGASAHAFRQRHLQVREFVLAALGQAAGLSGHVAEGLRGATPFGYSLDTAGAHAFLTETAPALEQAGFGVMLPAWWTGRGPRVRLAARAHANSPRLQAGQGLSLDAIAEVDWQIAVGDETLSLAELQELARLKSPLVRLRGRWVEVSAADLQRAITLLQRKGPGAAAVRDVVHMALGGAGEGAALPVDGLTATGWVGELLDRLQGREAFAELAAPAAFSGTLRPYQARGYSWLAFLRQWGLGACLADDMGLGKTVQTLALIQRDREVGSRRPVLLICPTSVAGNWRREAERFTPGLPFMVHHGPGRLRGAAFARAARRQAIVVSTYPLLHRDLDMLQPVPWAGIILDEAQNIKNAETRQARAARQIGGDFRIALTGTPVENNVGDLWAIMHFLNPGLLGSQADFRRRYFIPIQVQQDGEAAARLQRMTRPFILRRLKTDRAVISDLPDKIETRVDCRLTREQASLYAAVVREAETALDEADGIGRKGLVLATLSRLKQVCNHPAQFLGDNSALADRSGKLARLAELCEELLAVGDRALIFTQFAEMGHLLRRYLQETFGREVLFLHGGVPKAQRDHLVQRFQGEDGPPLFILSLKAGGTGLNLTRANHVFHFDRWWNPAVENQATDRAFRIGQNRTVQVHKFVCAGTLEEKIAAMIEQKQQMADRIVGTGESWLTELSTAELKDLFALQADAVEGSA